MSGLRVAGRVDERDVDAELIVPQGRVLAVIGPNGAGKSTMLQVASGLLLPDAGRVELDGRVLTDVEAGIQVPVHRRRIGLLAQSGLLFRHLSVLDNVAFGPRSQGASRHSARTTALEWLERVGVAELAPRPSRELSGGQAQRVALARTLAASPDALLLDEPTSALDVRVAAGLRQVLTEATRGLTTILVSHDLLDIVSLADEVAVIENGRVVEQGETARVLGRPTSSFAAGLAGVNLVRGRLDGTDALIGEGLHIHGIPEDEPAGDEVLAVIRPSSIVVSLSRPESSARNVWQGQVNVLEPLPHGIRVRADVGQLELAADITTASAAELKLAPGTRVWLSVKAQEVAISGVSAHSAPSSGVTASGA
ncbi:sulfate/molybdate ABC transporter ATP-binding protein [Brooklawnia cerclae]|uniref:Molybdate transport system ATP-binding protein n=1 Tax=Brooklawnia cerclae TaxID=349934 RepID=A0ABX0SDE9_9ACTN|nr:ATP-binding cassette domain-containing protein [Brooklawnia cerclae]NIH55996.1 molybdate transport system ATP-binding protein [Brooklawnia cerclae]